MKMFGIRLQEGSAISNLTVDSGTSFPLAPNEGELFYRSDTDIRVKGLYLYVNGSWDRIASTETLSCPTGTVLPSLANEGDLFYLNTNDAFEGLHVYKNSSWVNISAVATSNGTVTSVAATQPAAGLTISGSPITTSGTLTFALANDLAAVEELATTGLAVRSAADTWLTRTIAVSGSGLSVNDAGGVAGNPTIVSNATANNTASTLVFRDGSGNFSAGTITAALTGNATTATTLQTPRTINGVSFNGSANIQVNTVNLLTFNNSGSGASSGATFNGGTAITVSHNTIGAAALTASNVFTAANTFRVANAIRSEAAATQDAIVLAGRAGGTSSFAVTFTPSTLTANRTITLPDTTGTLALTADLPTVNNGTLTLGVAGSGLTGSASFTANQAGGSTFTVTSNATAANDPSTIVFRNNSGNFSAGTITAALSGNASTATALQTSRQISLSSDVTGSASFNGTADATITATLATVNSNVGTFGTATQVGTFTVNAKGLITAANNTNIAIAASQVTSGTFDNARIAASNVTQHQAALTILESQITDGTLLARNAGNETITGTWAFNNPISVGTPTTSSHATTKLYVDTIAQGLATKPAVEVATTGNLTSTYNNGTAGVGATLTATTNGAFPTIDGVTVASTTLGSNGVLVRAQSNPAHNGRYNLTQVGSGSTPWILTRCGVCDEANEIPGSYVFVKSGTLYTGTGWVQTVATPSTFVVGTDAITVTQFAGANAYIGGAGLTLTGNTFDVGTASTARIVVNTDNIDLATVSDGGGGSFLKFTRDGYGRVTGTSSVVAGDITALVNTTYVNRSGDTMTGALGVIGGSASAPGLYVVGDTNTGVFSATADTLSITTAGTSRIHVDSTGRTQVGPFTPEYGRFEIRTGAYTNSQAADGVWLRGTTSQGGAGWLAGFTLESDSGGTPTVRLQAPNAVTAGANTSVPFISARGAAGTINIVQGAGTGRQILLDSGGIVLQNGTNAASTPANTFLLVDRLNGSPLPALTSGTTATFAGSGAAGSSSIVQLVAGNEGGATIHFGDTDSATSGRIAYSNLNDEFVFTTNGNTAAIITSGNRLLLGPTTPQTIQSISPRIQIAGAINADSSLSLIRHNADTGGGQLYIGKTKGSGTTDVTALEAFDVLGQVMFVGSDGAVIANSATVRASSTETWVSGTNRGTRLEFFTTSNGAASPLRRALFTDTGEFLVSNSGALANARQIGTFNNRIQVETTNASAGISITRNTNDAASGALSFGKTRGTDVSAVTAVSNNDVLGRIEFSGGNGTDVSSVSALVFGRATENYTGSARGAELVFQTTANGSTSLTTAFTIGQDNSATFNGAVTVNQAQLATTSTTVTNTSLSIIDSVPAATFRSAKYLVQVHDTTNSHFHVVEILIIHNGTTVFKTEYAEVVSNASLGTFDADILSGNLRLTFTATAATTKNIKVVRTSVLS